MSISNSNVSVSANFSAVATLTNSVVAIFAVGTYSGGIIASVTNISIKVASSYVLLSMRTENPPILTIGNSGYQDIDPSMFRVRCSEPTLSHFLTTLSDVRFTSKGSSTFLVKAHVPCKSNDAASVLSLRNFLVIRDVVVILENVIAKVDAVCDSGNCSGVLSYNPSARIVEWQGTEHLSNLSNITLTASNCSFRMNTTKLALVFT